MKNPDKFIIGIVIGVIALVITAFVMVFLRPEPTYGPEDSPEGVAHNYLLALQQGDYTRAHSYLSPSLAGYPDAEAFAEYVRNNGWLFNFSDGSVTLELEPARRISDDRAVVPARARYFYQGGLFNSSEYTNAFDMTLRRENGAWKIISSDLYWAGCWNIEEGCQ